MATMREKIDVGESKSKKWRKRQLNKLMRRRAKRLFEDAPTKHLTKGWMT